MNLLLTLLNLIGLACMIWVIYDVFTNNKKLSTGLKVVWTICAVLFSIITAIIYYFKYK